MRTASRDYRQAFLQAQAELARAIQERDRWSLEIVRLQRLARSLAASTQASKKQEQMLQAVAAEISFIETVHAIIRSADRPLTPIDVRDRLAFHGYDLSVYSNPMGFVHTSLSRLKESGRIAEIRTGVYAPNHFWEALLRVQP
jgi:hypothetical protein